MRSAKEIKCNGCERTLSEGSFARDRSRRTGRQTQCRQCHKKHAHNHYEKYKDEYLDRQVEYRANRPECRAAHKAVELALNRGDLEKSPCEDCGAVGVDACHADYSKPLEITWRCRSCRIRHYIKLKMRRSFEYRLKLI